MRLLIVSVLFSITVSACGQQPPSGIDLMIEAVRWQGLNPTLITTGYAEIEMIAREGPSSQKSIQTDADKIAKELRKAYAGATNVRLKENVERAIQQLPHTLKITRNERRSRFRVLFDGNDFSGRRRFFVSNFNPLTETWSQPYEALRRDGNKRGGENVLWNPSARLVMIGHTDVALPEFHEFGRVCGPAAKMLTAALLQGSDPSAFEFSAENIERVKRKFDQILQETGGELYKLAGEIEYDDGAIEVDPIGWTANRVD